MYSARLHTTTAASTVDRIIDQFAADRQEQIRVMLSESLKGVIAQTLCRKIGGGRVAAREILLASRPGSNLIREGKTFQIPSIIQTSRRLGMVTLNDALMELVERTGRAPRGLYQGARQDRSGDAAQEPRHRHQLRGVRGDGGSRVGRLWRHGRNHRRRGRSQGPSARGAANWGDAKARDQALARR